MPDMLTVPHVREQLEDRRQRLQHEIRRAGHESALSVLLQEVDAALARVTAGTYGLCDTCHDTIEADRLASDPLVRFCLDHLPPAEQRALERDLELAAQIQRGLLPAPRLDVGGWQIAHHYAPSRLVSGDYCDVITTPAGDVYFMVGDVSGKGVAASMLMAHLHAMFRTLVPSALPLETLVERASRVFCESTLPTQYATLVCGRAAPGGAVELCNAGHPPPLLLTGAGVEPLASTGVPIGMFCGGSFGITRRTLAPGDALLLYTDGVLDAENAADMEYGCDRLARVADRVRGAAPTTVVDACVADLAAHVGAGKYGDDVTIMAVRRS